uniref:Uncharacterized protein n=1 Tax=Anguilla anguilla TaxID=7936 RepID=A0A0E9VQ01_ANGAN
MNSTLYGWCFSSDISPIKSGCKMIFFHLLFADQNF